jgi:hypothetical protein
MAAAHAGPAPLAIRHDLQAALDVLYPGVPGWGLQAWMMPLLQDFFGGVLFLTP